MELVNIVESSLEVFMPIYKNYRTQKRFSQIEERVQFLYTLSVDIYNSDELHLRLMVDKYIRDFYRLNDEIVIILLELCKFQVSNNDKKLLNLLLSVPAKTLNRVFNEIKFNIYQNSWYDDAIYILPKYKNEFGQVNFGEYFLEKDEQNDLINAGFIEPYASGMRYGYPIADAFKITKLGLKMLDILHISFAKKNKFNNTIYNLFNLYYVDHFNEKEELENIRILLEDFRDKFQYLDRLRFI